MLAQECLLVEWNIHIRWMQQWLTDWHEPLIIIVLHLLLLSSLKDTSNAVDDLIIGGSHVSIPSSWGDCAFHSEQGTPLMTLFLTLLDRKQVANVIVVVLVAKVEDALAHDFILQKK
jgi:hypothetical protein